LLPEFDSPFRAHRIIFLVKEPASFESDGVPLGTLDLKAFQQHAHDKAPTVKHNKQQ
jgi:hypothetical protein